MKINYDKLKLEADRKKISVHLLIKRKYHYRKSKNIRLCCFYCFNMGYINYNDGHGKRMQCRCIGESKVDRYADIKNLYICDCFNKEINI